MGGTTQGNSLLRCLQEKKINGDVYVCVCVCARARALALQPNPKPVYSGINPTEFNGTYIPVSILKTGAVVSFPCHFVKEKITLHCMTKPITLLYSSSLEGQNVQMSLLVCIHDYYAHDGYMQSCFQFSLGANILLFPWSLHDLKFPAEIL